MIKNLILIILINLFLPLTFANNPFLEIQKKEMESIMAYLTVDKDSNPNSLSALEELEKIPDPVITPVPTVSTEPIVELFDQIDITSSGIQKKSDSNNKKKIRIRSR